MKIFISYNHKDKDIAIKVQQYLENAGFTVIRDEEAMRSGEEIRKFIYRALREAGVVLSLISVNSLRSAWVSFETIVTEHGEKLLDTWWIPAYLDKDFFDRSFVGGVQSHAKEELEDIAKEIQKRLASGDGFEDLSQENKSFRNPLHHVDSIVADLRQRGCIDLTESNFEQGMDKIVGDLNEKIQTNANKNGNMTYEDFKKLLSTNPIVDAFDVLDDYYEQMGNDKSAYNNIKIEHTQGATPEYKLKERLRPIAKKFLA